MKSIFIFAIMTALFVTVSILVQGRMSASAQKSYQNEVEITTDKNYRYIKSNGIPDHPTGEFPNRNNPNRISPQNYRFRLPLHPKTTDRITPAPLFGVALNGVPFDPGTAEYWGERGRSAWRYEALTGKLNLGVDRNNAHVQPTGAYHYHGIPVGLVENLRGKDKEKNVLLIGYASDGFPVYSEYDHADPMDTQSQVKKMSPSYRLKKGNRPDGPGGAFDGTFEADWEFAAGSGDLDQCNGRFGKTPEFPEGIYHYFLTSEYPFIPRCVRGTPDESFEKRPPRNFPPAGSPDHDRPRRRP
ncbi:MAG: YHYH protein [Pyrinomonadaceae bacterium]